jgi:hypothetical protein
MEFAAQTPSGSNCQMETIMKHLTISLTPDGSFRLHLPSHSVTIPCTEAGARILATTIREWQDAPAPRVATPSAPIQAQIDAMLKGPGWGDLLQLAGDRRRRAEIKAATGVTIKQGKKPLSLADLGL